MGQDAIFGVVRLDFLSAEYRRRQPEREDAEAAAKKWPAHHQ